MSESRKGVYIWSSIDRIGNTVITFAGNIILARLLTPFDFGLVAIVGIFISIAYNISGCGLSDGLIRKLNPTPQDYSTVFVFNAVMGLLFCGFFLIGAEPVASFFNQPELVYIMWSIGISFFCASLTFTQETKMRKELQMKKLAIVKLSSTICAVGLGIILAVMGFGYWALVSSRIFLSIFLLIFYLLLSRWMPKVAFYYSSFKELFGFGLNLMLSYVANQIGRNINTFVLGRYSATNSGLYSQAQKMEEVPFGITESIFNWSFYPILANEPNETERKRLARNMFKNILVINVTVMMLLLLLSYPGFLFLFGEKWVVAVPIFRVLLIFGVCSATKYYIQTILKAYNKSDIIRNLTFIEVVMQLMLLVLFFHKGVLMIAMSQVIASTVVLVIYLYYYKKIEQITIMQLLKSIITVLPIPCFSFAITYILYCVWNGSIYPYLNCILILMSYLLAFIILCVIFRPWYYMVLIDKIKNRVRPH